MNESQKRLARHALGLPNKRNRSYRNKYVIGEHGSTYIEWQRMVKLGYATEDSEFSRDRALFKLTPTGAQVAIYAGETLDPEDFPDIAGNPEGQGDGI